MRRVVLLIGLGLLVALGGCAFLDTLSPNVPPTAVMDADPLEGRAPLRVQFDGSGSSDDGTIASYRWEFESVEDAQSVDGTRTEYTFTKSGVHTVRLKVTDEHGLAGTAEVEITVENTPPIASCRFSSDSPVIKEWILFDASPSFDPDGRIVDFAWDFGDGASTRGTRVGHAYDEVGVYSVRLTIEDNAGATASVVHKFTVHRGASGGGGCGGRTVRTSL